MTKDTVLITGGVGFVGCHLALELSGKGIQVAVVDGFKHDFHHPVYQEFIDIRLNKLSEAKIPVFRLSMTELKDVQSVFNEVKPNKVVHLAAIASATVCNKDPQNGYETNLHLTQMILEACRLTGSIERFVFTSSSMVYGNFRTDHVDETSPADPIGVYGAAKLSSELLIKAYSYVNDIPHVILRPSALYGATCINRRVSQIFIENALLGKTLFLEGGGKDRLDFTCVHDLVQGLMLALTHPSALNQTFNITYGESRAIRELVSIIKQRYPDVTCEDKPWEKTVPHRGTLDVSKAKSLLGYKPQYPLEKGYPLYISWYEDIRFKEKLASLKGV